MSEHLSIRAITNPSSLSCMTTSCVEDEVGDNTYPSQENDRSESEERVEEEQDLMELDEEDEEDQEEELEQKINSSVGDQQRRFGTETN
jgi:hypothetical protein